MYYSYWLDPVGCSTSEELKEERERREREERMTDTQIWKDLHARFERIDKAEAERKAKAQ